MRASFPTAWASIPFSYAMPRPNASDGSFRDRPQGGTTTGGTMTGRVTGTQISGKGDSSVCVYSFALDRA